ncbi:hypothetical protein AcW1_006097 [Taiwanofungus camphoratus]|nr:hypothetical protein AcW2_004859 [Antrodia cinnamomea]KAI0950074.1 hypothetical protein AcV7_008651 [Antrodia cinnamomea]KAI0957834.1 hypothetical protein AcW1_006097 [Antrodia cinnamomea]
MFSVIVLVAVDYIIKNLAELGSIIQMNILWDLEYLTSDQQIIKCLLVTNFGNYAKSKVSDGYMYSVLGTGVFNSDGDMWKSVHSSCYLHNQRLIELCQMASLHESPIFQSRQDQPF